MSISTSLSNALTGLTAASRAAELVSNNVSNAMTEGYGRREIVLGARALGGQSSGVRVEGVLRDVDANVIRDRRLADAALGERSTRSAALDRIGALAGTPGRPRLRRRPDSRVRGGPDDARPAAPMRRFACRATCSIPRARSPARSTTCPTASRPNAWPPTPTSRARSTTLNRGLQEVRDLNAQILRLGSASRDASALVDQRQRVIDSIAGIVPMREYQRDNGTVALYTTTGAALLDGRAATVGFTRSPTITPDMTLTSGALSGLTLDGKPVQTSGAFAPFAGGSLAAAFIVRDDLAITAQARADGLARDIVARFQDPAVDPTLAPGCRGSLHRRDGRLRPRERGGPRRPALRQRARGSRARRATSGASAPASAPLPPALWATRRS
jgi:flagellar hook-associated protein 1